MKVLLALGILVLASGSCDAATPVDSDLDVISVIPRSADVKPFVMSIAARPQHKRPAKPSQAAVVVANR